MYACNNYIISMTRALCESAFCLNVILLQERFIYEKKPNKQSSSTSSVKKSSNIVQRVIT